jgi:predicted flap endonuclease-1-like 5' DNA nuclease
MKTNELQGVTPELAAKLAGHGLGTSDQLLAAVAQPKDRAALAAKLGVDKRTLLELGNRSDLARIKGVGRVYSDLLEHAGVDTCVELSRRVPGNLFAKMQEVGATHQVQRLPRLDDVRSWVEQAKELGRAIFY